MHREDIECYIRNELADGDTHKKMGKVLAKFVEKVYGSD